MNSTFHRKIQTLKLIPKHPRKISSIQILEELKELGFSVEIRQLQRDLNSLSGLFEIENDGNKDILGWYWNQTASKLELPKLEPSVALSFTLTKKYLEKLFPRGIFNHLAPHFRHAESILNSLDTSLKSWPNKVGSVSRIQPLIPPTIKADVLDNIYEALLSDTKIKAIYSPILEGKRDYDLSPKAIVLVDQVIYLIAENEKNGKVSQYALHRFSSVENTENSISTSSDFEFQTYIDEGHLLYPYHDPKTIQLKLQVSERAAFIFSETKLSHDQTIEPAEDDEFIVTATVQNTEQLRWWLQSYSFYVEVLEPTSLREEFAEAASILNKIYN